MSISLHPNRPIVPVLSELLNEDLGVTLFFTATMTAAVVLKVLWIRYRTKQHKKKASKSRNAQVAINIEDQAPRSYGPNQAVETNTYSPEEQNQGQNGFQDMNRADRLSSSSRSVSTENLNNQQFYEHNGIIYHLYPAPTLSSDNSSTFPTYNSETTPVHNSKKASMTSSKLPEDLPPCYEDLSESPQINFNCEESLPPSYEDIFPSDSEMCFSRGMEIMV